MKLTSAYILGGMVALAASSQSLLGATAHNVLVTATASSAGNSDGTADNSNPYGIIMDRNIFRLNPQPPPPVAAEKPVELPKVYLNGIVRVGDDVRVLFSIPPKDSKSQTAYFRLSPGEMASGEKDDKLELVRIHPNQQEVDVLINGTPETLSVLSNSLASAGGGAKGPAPAAAPAVIANAPSAVVVGGGNASPSRYGGVAVASGGGGVTVIGGGSSSSGGGSGVAIASGNVSPASYGGGNAGVGGQIGALLSGSATQGQIGSTTTEPAASPEEQAVGLLAEHTKNPNGPPLIPPLAELVGEDTGVSTPPTGRHGGGAAAGGGPPGIP